jgi:hypothetical protein
LSVIAICIVEPDGLERVAEDLGFLVLLNRTPISGLDYQVPFLGNTPYLRLLLAVIGLIVVGVVVILLGHRIEPVLNRISRS